jgi:hypothetical protein
LLSLCVGWCRLVAARSPPVRRLSVELVASGQDTYARRTPRVDLSGHAPQGRPAADQGVVMDQVRRYLIVTDHELDQERLAAKV